MYLRLDKVQENNDTVSYSVETTIKDSEAKEHVLKVVKGFCIFNKVNEELYFDTTKTHSFYLKRGIESAHILYRLKQFNKTKKEFPNLFDIATG